MYKVNKHGGDGLWVLSLVLVISVFQDFFVYIWFDYFWVFTFRILHTTWGDKRWESGTSQNRIPHWLIENKDWTCEMCHIFNSTKKNQ